MSVELLLQHLNGPGDPQQLFTQMACPRFGLVELVLTLREFFPQRAKPAFQPGAQAVNAGRWRWVGRDGARYDWIPIHWIYHPAPFAVAGVSGLLSDHLM